MSSEQSHPLFTKLSALVAIPPLLFFAVQGAFSFQRGAQNTALGTKVAGIVRLTDSEQSLTLKVQIIGVYLLCLIVAVPRLTGVYRLLKQNIGLGILLAYAIASILWSSAPKATLISAVFIAIECAFAFYLVDRFRTEELMKLLIAVGWVAAIGSFFLIAMFPQYGIQQRSFFEHAWQGIFGQKNQCGAAFVSLLLPVFFSDHRGVISSLFKWAYVATATLFIYKSHSVGAWGVYCVCLLFIFTAKFLPHFRAKDRVVILMCMAALAMTALYGILENSEYLLCLFGKDSTLTGRTVIWGNVILSILNHPYLGYGLSAFWQGLHGESASVTLACGWGVGYSENGVLELALQLGLIGLAMYVMVFCRAVLDAAYCLRRNTSGPILWLTSVLVFLVASNIEGGNLVSPSDFGTVLSVMVFACLHREAGRLRSMAYASPQTTLLNFPEKVLIHDLPLTHGIGTVL